MIFVWLLGLIFYLTIMYTKVTEDCDDFGFALSELGMGGWGQGWNSVLPSILHDILLNASSDNLMSPISSFI